MAINKDTVRKHFNRYAHEYDRYAHVQRQMAKHLIALMERKDSAAGFGSVPRILEIGCGTGVLTRRLLSLYPHSDYTALDIAETMIEQTKQNTGGLGERIRFLHGDAEHFADTLSGQYDLIVSGASFQWFDDAERTVSAFVHKLAPRGALFFSTLISGTFHELHTSFHEAENKLRLEHRSHGTKLWSGEEWQDLFHNMDRRGRFHWESDEKKEWFPNVRDFLSSVKRIGAGNAASEKKGSSAFMSRELWSAMQQVYRSRFSHNDLISATYEIGYGSYQLTD